MNDESPQNYRPKPGWFVNSLPADKRNELMALTQKAMKDFQQLQEDKNRLRQILIKGDRPVGSDSSDLSSMSGCIVPLICLVALGIIHFAEPSKTAEYTIGVATFIIIIGLKVAAAHSDKKHKEWLAQQPKASDLVNTMISNSYAFFKKENPGKLFGEAKTEEDSVAAHRVWWKTTNDFNIQGFE
jgi:hypothetical protein